MPHISFNSAVLSKTGKGIQGNLCFYSSFTIFSTNVLPFQCYLQSTVTNTPWLPGPVLDLLCQAGNHPGPVTMDKVIMPSLVGPTPTYQTTT